MGNSNSAPVAGGFAEGDHESVVTSGYWATKGICVESMIAHTDANGTLAVGDVGTVNGPCSFASILDASGRVNCSFPLYSSINVHVDCLQPAPIAGNFAKGDRVESMIARTDANGTLAVGDVGMVNGPCSFASTPDASGRVNCSFPHFSSINVHVDCLRHAPIAGGLCEGRPRREHDCTYGC